MGQGYSHTALPAGPSAIETPELGDLVFERNLGGARFLRTVRARRENGVVVAKVCMKSSSSVSFKKYVKAIRDERRLLLDVPNALPYRRVLETANFGVLVRQFIHSSLYDRISIRPFLEGIEKKWIAFQLLCAVRDCHSRNVFHGDIKSENVLITSWGWVYLTDFSSGYKPVYLPEDNPADFTFYFDTSARRTCYLAPERFLAAGENPNEGNVVQWNMDIFSLGCVIAELFTEAPTFTLSQLFKYRKGEYDPTIALLNKIGDEHICQLISSMIRLDPQERWHAQDYLDEYKGKAFPLYFYQHLHTLMQEVTDPSSGRKPVTVDGANSGIADDRINRVYDDFEMLSVSLGYVESLDALALEPAEPGWVRGLFPMQIDLPNSRHSAKAALHQKGDNGTFILLNVITASVRSAARATSKIRACELLLAFAERLPDEAKLDRVLPYVMPLLEDNNEMVLVAALRTMTQLLALVTVASPVNSFLFTQYIFPRLQQFVASPGFRKHTIVRATYAACLASLAESATRFLNLIQALRADGSLPSADPEAVDDANGAGGNFDAYDTTRAELLEQFEGQTKVFLTDNETSVRRAFLSSVSSLCVFFGEHKASDVLLSHLNTYLNDPDWLLKCAFFRAIVGVAVYVGGASMEDFILPLMLQALTDPQEFVVEQALRSLASMAEIGLLQRAKTWELIDTVARFTMHPNLWIREAATHFISAATRFLSVSDVRILVAPLVQPYLKMPVANVSETELLDALKKPLPRTVLDMALQWATRAERGVFWKPAKESRQLSYHAHGHMPPLSSVADLPKSLAKVPKNDEDEQWLGRLRNAGMRSEDEIKILAFREYVWRAAQRKKREEASEPNVALDGVISLAKLKIRPHTVLFDNSLETYENRLQEDDHARTIDEAIREAATAVQKQESRATLPNVENNNGELLQMKGESAHNGDKWSQPLQIPGLRSKTSGSLSSSPSSAMTLLGRDNDRSGSRSGGLMVLPGSDTRNKSLAEVVIDDATAAGKLEQPATGSRKASPVPGPSAQRGQVDRANSSRAFHNYAGNDPTVLKLLDAVYVDSFPGDALEFGPMIQSTKRGPIQSNTVSSTGAAGTWRPQGRLVTVLNEHTDKVTRLLASPDHLFFLSASDDGTVKVWDAERLERNVSHRSRGTYRMASGVKVTSLCFVEATHTFVASGSDGTVHLVRVDVADSGNATKYGKMRMLREWKIPSASSDHEHAVASSHFRGEAASTLVLATNLNRILAVDLRYMTTIFDLRNPAQHGAITTFCIGRRQDWLLAGTSHGVLDLWDLRFKLRLRSWAFPSAAPITRLQLHPSRKTARRNRVCISGGTNKGEVTVWDIEKGICHEVYQPAVHGEKERLHLRDYELRNLDDDKYENLLGRVTDSTRSDKNLLESSVAAPAVSSSVLFGLQQALNDTELQHAFAITGGPDNKVRFWDCERLDGCRLVSGAGPDAKPSYTFSSLGLDTRVLSEKFVDGTQQTTGAIESNTVTPNTPVKRPAISSRSSTRPSRYETIRLSAQQLLDGHLDTITDVALLERPFGMVLSADRSGQIFVHQ